MFGDNFVRNNMDNFEHWFCTNAECRNNFSVTTDEMSGFDGRCPECEGYMECYPCDGWDGSECSCEYAWEEADS